MKLIKMERAYNLLTFMVMVVRPYLDDKNSEVIKSVIEHRANIKLISAKDIGGKFIFLVLM